MKKIIIPFVFIIHLQSCVTHKAAFKGQPFKFYDKVEEAGFDQNKLTELTEYIDKNSSTTGLMVLYNGKVVYEYGNLEKVSYIASCRKSVLSMLYGKYVDNGTIDLKTTIGKLGIDEKDGLLPKEKTATINDLITSRSGVHHVASNGGYDKDNFLERGSVEPGEYFVYNNWDFNVSGHILELYTQKSIYEELEDQLAKPLGFQDWNIENQRKSGNKSKSQYKAYHMYLSTRDMAKIGQLMLNNGEWNGQQLISKEWIEKTTTTVTPFETMVERYGSADPNGIHMSYGYMWWLLDNYQGKKEYKGAYSAIGYGGQYITVFPELDLVIAHKTKLGLFKLIGVAKDGDAHYWDIVHKIVDAKSNNHSNNDSSYLYINE
jgi:CubicO group peptidase (beta-lactamase class C family)